jgi:hypothetical protein
MRISHYTRHTALAAALLAGIAAGPAIGRAQATPPAAGDIVRSLEGRGYTNVHDAEWDDGHWEVDATNPSGKPVDLEVAPDGTITNEKPD